MPSVVNSVGVAALDAAQGSRVVIASVPVPRGQQSPPRFADAASQAVPIAWYSAEHGDGPGLPRRYLVVGVTEQDAPDRLALTDAASDARQRPLPTCRIDTLEKKTTGLSGYEVNELVISHAGRSLGVRLGVLKDSGPAWWQWLRVETLWSGPVCSAISAAGYVSVSDLKSDDEIFDPKVYNQGPQFHVQHWLFVEVYALLFANGLVRVTARHVNNRFFDQGRDLAGFVPIIGFRPISAPAPAAFATPAPLDNARRDFDLGGVNLDLARHKGLVSAEHPGKLWQLESHGKVIAMQPYAGVEMDLGSLDGAEWKLHASERRMWKGLARCSHFDLTFGAAPIRTRRYLPPRGWQAYCGSLWPGDTLPARGPWEPFVERYNTQKSAELSGRFFDASSGGDGESPYGGMLQAYRTGRADLYDAAIHHAYGFADIGLDHAEWSIRIGGQVRGAISLVLQRNLGMLAGYLETGDPYLLACAAAVADAAFATDTSNWPRRSYGRDASYIRSLTWMYEVTGERFYLRRAATACRRAGACQYPDGHFTDQGGACGTHGHLNLIVKPWMNSILSEALVDYLERVPDDEPVARTVLRCADWILGKQLTDADGKYWAYEYAWGDNDHPPYSKYNPEKPPQRHPSGEMQLDYLGRILLWASHKTGDPKYARAWQESVERYYRKKALSNSAHGWTKTVENMTWHESHLWNARWDAAKAAGTLDTLAGLTIAPITQLLGDRREAQIDLPTGGRAVVRYENDKAMIVGIATSA